MTGDNFYSMQDDWKVEIDEMLLEIRFREEVRRATYYSQLVEGRFQTIFFGNLLNT